MFYVLRSTFYVLRLALTGVVVRQAAAVEQYVVDLTGDGGGTFYQFRLADFAHVERRT